MFYTFIEDQSFYPQQNIDLGTVKQPLAGYLSTQEAAYFYKKATITDPRTERNLFHNKELIGKIKLYFDKSKHTEETIFSHITDEDLEKIFKLFERIYLSTDETLAEIEADLITNVVYSDIYVPSSLKLSKYKTSIAVYQGVDQIDTLVPDYFDITIQFVEQVKFRVWLASKSFLENYPLSTIVKVVLPCDHSYILNPSKFDSPVDAIIKGTGFSFPTIDKDVSIADQSGLMVYKTRYKISSLGIQMLPFGILYNGAQPSTMEIRKAIRELLLSYGTADKSVWESLLPDLFVTGQFFLIPIYNHTTVRPERKIFPSIISLSKFNDIFTTLFPMLDEQFIKDKQELITVGQSEVFILTLPDALNEKEFSIYSIHPTYQYHTTQDVAHAYMAPETKEFNIRLNRCMAVLMGESIADDITDSVIDERKYKSFVSGAIEYHILTQESYNKIFIS